MTAAEARERIAELRAEVARHDELYYRRAKPEITDLDYDRLKRELADLESSFPGLRAADSPTQRVGDDRLPGFAVYRHRLPMQSLDNTYSDAELRAFHQRRHGLAAVEHRVRMHRGLHAVEFRHDPRSP